MIDRQIQINGITEENIEFTVSILDTILSLKDKIKDKFEFNVNNQILVFDNTRLEDDKIFRFYNINIFDYCFILKKRHGYKRGRTPRRV